MDDPYAHILYNNDALKYLDDLTNRLNENISDLACDIAIARKEEVVVVNDIIRAFYSVLQTTLNQCDYIPPLPKE